jgi:hypothetical protein
MREGTQGRRNEQRERKTNALGAPCAWFTILVNVLSVYNVYYMKPTSVSARDFKTMCYAQKHDIL